MQLSNVHATPLISCEGAGPPDYMCLCPGSQTHKNLIAIQNIITLSNLLSNQSFLSLHGVYNSSG